MNARTIACCALVFLFAPLAARASVIIAIDPQFGSTENTGATALLTLTFELLDQDARMTVKIENTTPGSLGSSLTAIGLELPNVLPITASFAPGGKSSYFTKLDQHVSVSPGKLNAAGGYDLMLTSDHKFEGGNPHGAPTAGQSQTVVLSLGQLNVPPGEVEAAFATFYNEAGEDDSYAIARFQAVGPGGDASDKILGRTPEPGALALLLIGTAFLGRRLRRQ